MTFVNAVFFGNETDWDSSEDIALVKLTHTRGSEAVVTGGFANNFAANPMMVDPTDNVSATPFRIHYYKIRVCSGDYFDEGTGKTNKQPGILYSSEYQTGTAMTKRGFSMINTADDIVKKWRMISPNVWSWLTHSFVKSRMVYDKERKRKIWKKFGKPHYVNDHELAWSAKNLAPTGVNNADFSWCCEIGIEYDFG